jgi:hypothetical protein
MRLPKPFDSTVMSWKVARDAVDGLSGLFWFKKPRCIAPPEK